MRLRTKTRALAGVLALSLAACNSVDPASLPPLPDVQSESFLPAVQTQIDQALAAVQAEPTDAAATGELAMILHVYKQIAAADVAYQRARLLEPDRFQWAYLHGVAQVLGGRSTEAMATFQDALALEDYPLAKIRLAELLFDDGQDQAAEALYDEVMSLPRPASEAFFSHGKFLLKQARHTQAIAAFEQALRMSGDLGPAYYQLGLAHRALGHREDAEKNFELAKAHQGYSADGSDVYLNKLLRLNLSPMPFVRRAKVLVEAGRQAEAERFLNLALERDPNNVAAHANMMGLAVTRQDFAAVDRHFDSAFAVEPDNAKIHFNLGIARVVERRFVEAERAFAKSVALDNTDPSALVELAKLEHLHKKKRRAKRHLGEALALDPAHQVGNWLYGEAALEDGDPETAVTHLTRALESPHELAPLIYGKLAQAHLARDDKRAGLEAVGRARASLNADTTARFGEFLDSIEADLNNLAGASQ